MKLLMIYMESFSYTPTVKTIDSAPEISESKHFEKVQTAFIHVEAEDVEKETDVKRKLLKNLKWIAGKNQTNHIILHSFAHLSGSKADPEFTKTLYPFCLVDFCKGRAIRLPKPPLGRVS